MIAFWILGTIGLVLILVGIPHPHTAVRARVEPFVEGLHPRAARGMSRRYRPDQMIWAAVGAICGLVPTVVGWLLGGSVHLDSVPILVGLCAGVGWLGRDRYLTHQAARRVASVRDDLPLFLDLMTLSLVAGEGVVAACRRVAGRLPDGPLAHEIDNVVADVRAGTTAIGALRALASRVDEPSIGRMVDALTTAIERGAPLAESLRAQADEVRDADRRRLLELGGKREVLMLVPVVFLIMPVVVVFALMPGLVSLDLLVP
ncbi:MAG TPA: type II secretion system F family protein [Actinomycetota bacterium]|nr:type II secretion system F family protein [Actinomycetota bacterium]